MDWDNNANYHRTNAENILWNKNTAQFTMFSTQNIHFVSLYLSYFDWILTITISILRDRNPHHELFIASFTTKLHFGTREKNDTKKSHIKMNFNWIVYTHKELYNLCFLCWWWHKWDKKRYDYRMMCLRTKPELLRNDLSKQTA